MSNRLDWAYRLRTLCEDTEEKLDLPEDTDSPGEGARIASAIDDLRLALRHAVEVAEDVIEEAG